MVTAKELKLSREKKQGKRIKLFFYIRHGWQGIF